MMNSDEVHKLREQIVQLEERVGRRDAEIKRLKKIERDLETEKARLEVEVQEKETQLGEWEKEKEEEMNELREKLQQGVIFVFFVGGTYVRRKKGLFKRIRKKFPTPSSQIWKFPEIFLGQFSC